MKTIDPINFLAVQEVLEEQPRWLCAGCHSKVPSHLNNSLKEGDEIYCPVCGNSHVITNFFNPYLFAVSSLYSGAFGLSHNPFIDIIRLSFADGLNFPLRIPSLPKEIIKKKKNNILLAFVQGRGVNEEDMEENN